MLCSAWLLKRRARRALNHPENAGRVGEGGELRAAPSLPAGPGRGTSAASSCGSPSLAFPAGEALYKAEFGMGVLIVASPRPRGFGGFLLPTFPPSPVFLAGFAPGWHSWMSAGLRHWRKPPSHSAIYLLGLAFASLHLLTPRERHQPLTLAVRGGQRGRSHRMAPLQR